MLAREAFLLGYYVTVRVIRLVRVFRTTILSPSEGIVKRLAILAYQELSPVDATRDIGEDLAGRAVEPISIQKITPRILSLSDCTAVGRPIYSGGK